MAITNTGIFGIMFEVGLLIASLKISTLVTNLLKHMQNDSCNFVNGIRYYWIMFFGICG